MSASPAEAKLVLVVDDEAGIRHLISTRLRMAGYEVHVARNGVEALQRLRELRPQAMVLDINMPELDGFGVLAALKNQSSIPTPPTMVLTARHAAEDVRNALGLGAKDYLTKPFNELQLLARVARLLRPRLDVPKQAPPTDDAVML
jgi:two-component system OmpR family response regulator